MSNWLYFWVPAGSIVAPLLAWLVAAFRAARYQPSGARCEKVISGLPCLPNLQPPRPMIEAQVGRKAPAAKPPSRPASRPPPPLPECPIPCEPGSRGF